MSLRRVASFLTVALVASTATFVAAAPKKAPAKKAPAKKAPTGPVAPAKEPAAGSGSGSASGAGGGSATGAGAGSAAPADTGATGGSAVEMTEDPAPADMEGTNENPDAPRVGDEQNRVVPVAVTEKPKRSGYPTEEIFRPITLPENMSEVSLDLHAALSPYTGAGVIRARYGITRQVQLGLTYLAGGIYNDSKFGASLTDKTKFHAGKAVGLDVTVLVQNWLGIRVGVPVYVDPVAVGLTLGAPIKFTFFDKLSLTGLEDIVNIKLTKFMPNFYYQSTNAAYAAAYGTNTRQQAGYLNFAFTATYQNDPMTAFQLHAGVRLDDFSGTQTSAGAFSGSTTFLRVGIERTVKQFFDVGGSLGFDDLAHGGTFGPQVYAAVRI
ncbi:MAG TPA: hypothetical protein VGM90_15095 [Kofleriaceae bacterium]|jgi:hypothetical protein